MSFDRSRLESYRQSDARAAYSAAGGSEVDLDPYEAFAAMRREAAIVHTDLHRGYGVQAGIGTTIASGGYADVDPARIYSAVRFDAVSDVLRSNKFDNSAHLRAYEPFLGRTLITLDGPEHRRARGLVNGVFTRRAVERWTAELLEPLGRNGVEHLRGSWALGGAGVDLVDGFILDFPAQAITAILGLDEGDVESLIQVAMTMITFAAPDKALQAGRDLQEWITDLAEEARTTAPGPDLLSQLVHVSEEGEQLTNDEIGTFLRLLFVGGFETSVKGLSNVVVGLLGADQWGDVCKDRSLVPMAIEEGLRWQTSVLGAPRVAQQDNTVADTDLRAGDVVLCFLASANRDESRWVAADRFDVHRERKPHIAFGLGSHLCAGIHLARAEMAVALNALMDAFPDLRSAPDPDNLAEIRGLASRGPRAVPVLLSA